MRVRRKISLFLFVLFSTIIAKGQSEGILFQESFDDANLESRGWFDGKLVIDYDDVVLRSADFPKLKINQFLIGPYFSPALIDNNQK